MSSRNFEFRSNQNIGSIVAETDKKFLSECFVDIGMKEILLDCTDHRCILLGRTGSGKSALIQNIYESQEHVIKIDPNSLALDYISNSNVINFFSG